MKGILALVKRLISRSGRRRSRGSAYQPLDTHHWGNRMEIDRHLRAPRRA